MAGIGTLVDLLLFYTLERVLFNRMVRSMGKDSYHVKRAMALWLTLEEIGFHDLIRMIHSNDDETIEVHFNETLRCIQSLEPNATLSDLDDAPVFLGLLEEPLNRRFFYYNRDFLHKRFVHILETICNKIFGENSAVDVDESGLRPVARSSSSQGPTRDPGETYIEPCETWVRAGEARDLAGQSILNPGASEFHPWQTPEDTRTMFLTFSRGHPLSRDEIIEFFTSKWGDVVQDVVIEHTPPGQDPQYGRIVFTTSLVIPKILNGQSKAKFVVNRKHLWARIYVPRSSGRMII